VRLCASFPVCDCLTASVHALSLKGILVMNTFVMHRVIAQARHVPSLAVNSSYLKMPVLASLWLRK